MTSPDAHRHPRVAVLGLWHLGCVTAACVADPQWPVLGLEEDLDVVAGLDDGRPPLMEPGLPELVDAGRRAGTLAFSSLDDAAIGEAEIVWIAWDTPVDDDDVADVEWVLSRAARVLAGARQGALVVSSSQLPVGSMAELARRMREAGRDDLHYACVPENLRLGRAIDVFTHTDRFVAGVREESDRARLEPLLTRFTDRIEWMGVESAEMTKHALNAFLATSVAFINEIAAVCERVDADAAEVARGLKSESRIGPGAYLSPGDAFAGGTLARDIVFLGALADREDVPAVLVTGVRESNVEHRAWAWRTLERRLGADGLRGARIAVWGLTYKPNTSTLRRSSSIALCRRLIDAGAEVVAHDPGVDELGADQPAIELAADPLSAARGAQALVVSTPWPVFGEVDPDALVAALDGSLVIDAGGALAGTLSGRDDLRYLRVGVGS